MVRPDVMVSPDVMVRPDVVVQPDVAVDRATPVDTGTPVAVPDTTLMVPTFDAATVAHIREVRARGLAMGMRPTVFAKIGDSITESASFLSDIGYGWYNLGTWTALEPTVRYFSATPATGGSMANSFNRASVCAMGGWIAAYAVSNDPDSALRRELNATRPAYAMVMYGTNDLDYGTVATFRTNMNRILDVIESYGTVAALSTIPDRLDRADSAALVPTFNAAIRDMAATRHLPLMEFWGALQPLPRRGVDPDGIHPSAYLSGGSTACGVLSDAGLRFGYNMRNLVALALLERLRNLP
jgi:lysophospholipase L1-like esterase